MGIGIDYNNINSDFVLAKTRNFNNQTSRYQGARIAQTTDGLDTYVSSKGNTCTDGNDDGKIGLLSATGNIIEGAGKSILNTVKGAFTNSEGKFSLLKTATTIGLGAACVAFPAVGLVACGVGAVTGTVKFASGVAKAVNATTDAEAKDAWEAVGEGGITVAGSVLGAKASYNAVQSSAAAASGIGKSAVQQLGKDASALSKLSALGKDMASSTKFNATNIKDALELEVLRTKANRIKPNSALNPEEKVLLDNLYAKEAFATDNAKAQANMIENAKNFSANKINNAKQALSNLKNDPKAGFTQIKTTASNLGATLKNLKTNANLGKLTAGLSEKSQNIINFLASEQGTYANAVQNFGHTNVLNALEEITAVQNLNQTI